MKKSQFQHAIEECLNNGERLLSDVLMLEFEKPPSTAFALVIIAQEEFAKAYLLTLVDKGVIPWNKLIWRATRDHTCKHLLCMIMDYLYPDTEEFLARMNTPIEESLNKLLPSHIADAINILRYDKIEKWASGYSCLDEDYNHDPKAKRVADGKLDKLKHDQFYVDVSKNGSVIPKTAITQKQYEDEKYRADRLLSLIRGMIKEDDAKFLDYEGVSEAFQVLFSNITLDDE